MIRDIASRPRYFTGGNNSHKNEHVQCTARSNNCSQFWSLSSMNSLSLETDNWTSRAQGQWLVLWWWQDSPGWWYCWWAVPWWLCRYTHRAVTWLRCCGLDLSRAPPASSPVEVQEDTVHQTKEEHSHPSPSPKPHPLTSLIIFISIQLLDELFINLNNVGARDR